MREPPPDFHRQVYDIVRLIPRGRVMTYGGIAALVPPPKGMDLHSYARIRARWVGYAMASCPDDLPWQRVVNAQGRISPRPGHGPHVQRILLEQDGVIFGKGERIDLTTYLWTPDLD